MPKNGGSLVARVARELSAISLAGDEGAYIGAEDDLLVRLGVSRPTLRQAAKIVESERMITVRRGLHGGFYAARPDARDAIRTLNRYLRVRGATLREISVVARHISGESAQLAAACTDEAMRAQLRTIVGEIMACNDARALMELETRFDELVARMSGNPMIELMVAMVYAFGWEEQGILLYQDPAQRETTRGLITAILQAILNRDGEVARLMMNRRTAQVQEWLDTADPSLLGPVREF